MKANRWEAVALACAGLLVSETASAQCSGWQSGFANGPDSDVDVMEVFDDGRGPALFVAGRFTSVAGLPANRVARWDGASWEALGGGLTAGVSGTGAMAMEVFDDGSGPKLYVGGAFTLAGGVPANRIAVWDGSTWSGVGGGMDDGIVQALRVYDDGSGPVLVAAGRFTSIAGTPAGYMARWDGSSWTEFAGGSPSWVQSLEVFDAGAGPDLYAAGWFSSIGSSGTPASLIARWDGAAWHALGAGVNHPVDDMTVYDDGFTGPGLIVAGAFTTAGGNPYPWIARWDGADWSSLGNGPTNIVTSVAVLDTGYGCGPVLVAGGLFGSFGSGSTKVALWNGTNWAPMGSGTSGYVWSAMEYDDGSGPALYAGGGFSSMGGVSSLCLAKWTDTCPCLPSTYCAPGLTTSGCLATISSTGTPSSSTTSGFVVTVTEVEGDKNGILFFGTTGWQDKPWGSGSSFMCVNRPRRRTGFALGTGTPGACDGSLVLDFNAWMAAYPTSAPAAGQRVWMQAWFRDPPSPATTNLSDALSFVVQP